MYCPDFRIIVASTASTSSATGADLLQSGAPAAILRADAAPRRPNNLFPPSIRPPTLPDMPAQKRALSAEIDRAKIFASARLNFHKYLSGFSYLSV
jgi:hypothetical protein